jgi:hypothetical protein
MMPGVEAILLDVPGYTYGDSAYQGSRPERIIHTRGGIARVVHTSTWDGPDALRRLLEQCLYPAHPLPDRKVFNTLSSPQNLSSPLDNGEVNCIT